MQHGPEQESADPDRSGAGPRGVPARGTDQDSVDVLSRHAADGGMNRPILAGFLEERLHGNHRLPGSAGLLVFTLAVAAATPALAQWTPARLTADGSEIPFLAAATALNGGLALVLGLVGTYGLVSFLTSRRTHKIGVRLIARPCLRWTLAGVGVGVGSSLALTRGPRRSLVRWIRHHAGVRRVRRCRRPDSVRIALRGLFSRCGKTPRADVVFALRHE